MRQTTKAKQIRLASGPGIGRAGVRRAGWVETRRSGSHRVLVKGNEQGSAVDELAHAAMPWVRSVEAVPAQFEPDCPAVLVAAMPPAAGYQFNQGEAPPAFCQRVSWAGKRNLV